jgi:multimeric flavodoxin WrbA
MLDADAVVLASPTYFSDVSAEMKALIDRAGMVARVNGDMLARMVGAGVAVARRGGCVHTFDTLNHFFLIGQMIVPGSSYWNVGQGLDRGDVASDSEGLQTMQTLGRNMAWLMQRLRT